MSRIPNVSDLPKGQFLSFWVDSCWNFLSITLLQSVQMKKKYDSCRHGKKIVSLFKERECPLGNGGFIGAVDDPPKDYLRPSTIGTMMLPNAANFHSRNISMETMGPSFSDIPPTVRCWADFQLYPTCAYAFAPIFNLNGSTTTLVLTLQARAVLSTWV